MIVYLTGGVRSGKSSFAMELALQKSQHPVYVATSRIWDEDFAKRVKRHQDERGPEWASLESEKDIHLLPLTGKVAVIDCVTLWLTNLFVAFEFDIEKSLAAFKAEIDALVKIDATLIIISNEIGMGVHAETEAGRKFADLQGWANQHVAAVADEAIMMVSGIPLTLKSMK
ncbi:bifunctional adenosylcobinamide kinase/adenosylcobinamide-phosphate guanylyltransferase [Dyadobacter sp. CY261]|uniref:bifunctional adenosylcobinamide kinase/adenosylcobinamide-phosphate guanylyltransferase n=1 Tax=Dyadobacter sp. CY261 TaxID=2907203 RepID=UPI001F37205A|nr:bifunctional adenosylcobinamide kinase/adenosylcobinamide-phosphate guanylyltransferase [Dyadobacter sp. CY261]MCF0071148.1 bifunctional adenosylcobinamide kinase/adenosylcobinamide-phosphate guanylyltransferase [Dyadobacter sp. CY261]